MGIGILCIKSFRGWWIMGEEAVFYEFIIALCMGMGALGVFIWAVMSGQLDETEDIKYRILEREMEDGKREV